MTPPASRRSISDFGGVLTSALIDSFVGVLGSSGVSLEELGKAMAAVAEREGSNPLFELETGRLSEAQFMGTLSDELSASARQPGRARRLRRALLPASEPNERLIDYMRGLRERGYKLAICTNNVREWEGRWRAMLPVDEIFDVVVDSAFVGSRKPEPRIYEITLERLGTARRGDAVRR